MNTGLDSATEISSTDTTISSEEYDVPSELDVI
jgi:hypothetical protein